MHLEDQLLRFVVESAERLRERNASYASMPLDDVVEAGELLLASLARLTDGADARELDAHLQRTARNRAAQLMTPHDLLDAFTEIRRALGTATDVEPRPSLAVRAAVFRAVDDAEVRALRYLLEESEPVQGLA